MKTYLDCWIKTAGSLWPQALAGAPDLVEALPQPFTGEGCAFTAMLAGDCEGAFTVTLDGAILETPLMGEGLDQKEAWGELLRETAGAAAGEMLPAAGSNCRVAKFELSSGAGKATRAFQLKAGERSWSILVLDRVRAAGAKTAPDKSAAAAADKNGPGDGNKPHPAAQTEPAPALRPGLELLLDVELEASLRFGSREMTLGDILDLGPGDVVQLDRQVAEPVDLIVADKIVARGDVVLVNGNFGLRVTEVAAPRKRLESIRCLF